LYLFQAKLLAARYGYVVDGTEKDLEAVDQDEE